MIKHTSHQFKPVQHFQTKNIKHNIVAAEFISSTETQRCVTNTATNAFRAVPIVEWNQKQTALTIATSTAYLCYSCVSATLNMIWYTCRHFPLWVANHYVLWNKVRDCLLFVRTAPCNGNLWFANNLNGWFVGWRRFEKLVFSCLLLCD